MSNLKIKPCPWCGNDLQSELLLFGPCDSTNGEAHGEEQAHYIVCALCHAQGPERKTETGALRAWEYMSSQLEHLKEINAKYRSGYTEKDARKKACPIFKISSRTCSGSGCMAWTWLKTEYGRHKRGYCSLLKAKQESNHER